MEIEGRLNRVLNRGVHGITALVVAATNIACQPDMFTVAPYSRNDENRYIILNQIEINGIHPTISINCGKDPSVPSPRNQVEAMLDSVDRSGIDKNSPYRLGLILLRDSNKLPGICND